MTVSWKFAVIIVIVALAIVASVVYFGDYIFLGSSNSRNVVNSVPPGTSGPEATIVASPSVTPEVAEATGSFHAMLIVTDKISGLRITDATIHVGGKDVSSDQEGTIPLSVSSSGTPSDFTVTVEGYQDATVALPDEPSTYTEDNPWRYTVQMLSSVKVTYLYCHFSDSFCRIYQSNIDGTDAEQFSDDLVVPDKMAVSPRFRKALYLARASLAPDAGYVLYLVDLRTREKTALDRFDSTFPTDAFQIRWAADGGTVAWMLKRDWSDQGGNYMVGYSDLLRETTGYITRVRPANVGGGISSFFHLIYDFAVSPDGKHIALSTNSEDGVDALELYDPSNNQFGRQATSFNGTVYSAVFGPDHLMYFYDSTPGPNNGVNWKTWNVQSGRIEAYTEMSPAFKRVFGRVMSWDHQKMAYECRAYSVCVSGFGGQDEKAVFTLALSEQGHMKAGPEFFSPDGKYLFVHSTTDYGKEELWAVSATVETGERVRVTLL